MEIFFSQGDVLSITLNFLDVNNLKQLRFMNRLFNEIIVFLPSFLLIYGNKLIRYHISQQNNQFIDELIHKMNLNGFRINYNKIINCATWNFNENIIKKYRKYSYKTNFDFIKNKNLNPDQFYRILKLLKYNMFIVVTYCIRFKRFDYIEFIKNKIQSRPKNQIQEIIDLLKIYEGHIDDLIVPNATIIPIFSPNCDFKKIIDQLKKFNVKFILINDPEIYDYLNIKSPIFSLIDYHNQIIVEHVIKKINNEQTWNDSFFWIHNELIKYLKIEYFKDDKMKLLFYCMTGNIEEIKKIQLKQYNIVHIMRMFRSAIINNRVHIVKYFIDKIGTHIIHKFLISDSTKRNYRKMTCLLLEYFNPLSISELKINHNARKTSNILIDYIEKNPTKALFKCANCDNDLKYHKNAYSKFDF